MSTNRTLDPQPYFHFTPRSSGTHGAPGAGDMTGRSGVTVASSAWTRESREDTYNSAMSPMEMEDTYTSAMSPCSPRAEEEESGREDSPMANDMRTISLIDGRPRPLTFSRVALFVAAASLLAMVVLGCAALFNGGRLNRSGGLLQPKGKRDLSSGSTGVQPGVMVVRSAPVQHADEDCWTACHQRAGFCTEFCGRGNVCCRAGSSSDAPECEANGGDESFHRCAAPVKPLYQIKLEDKSVKSWGANCAIECGKAGFCSDTCGLGNACCKFGDALSPPECGGILEWGAKDVFTCVKPVRPEYMIVAAPTGTTIQLWGEACWDVCGQSAGFCTGACGLGNSCCKFLAKEDPAECQGITEWGAKDRYTCVVPVDTPSIGVTAMSSTDQVVEKTVDNWGIDCFEPCGNAGYCQEFCGMGNTCCRSGDLSPTPECVGITEFGSEDFYTCVAPVNPAFITAEAPEGVNIKHWGTDCKPGCNSTAGYCPGFCGTGNACCRFQSATDPQECHGILQFGAKDRYTCVAPVNPVWQIKVKSDVQFWGQDCWAPCGERGGVCPNFCGIGNACCKFGDPYDPQECQGVLDWGAKDHHTCVKPVNKGVLSHHMFDDCWDSCNGAGYCESWCGEGNACCRRWAKTDPDECKGVFWWPASTIHTCVRASLPRPGPPEAEADGECIPGEVRDRDGNCRPATGPALMSIYMYKAATDVQGSRIGDVKMGNGNFANLEGVLWQVHKDVVTTCPRRNNVNRIIRYVVTMQNPDSLFQSPLHFQFGPYTKFSNGQCMFNNSQCGTIWEKYGYAVGCQIQNSLDPSDPIYESPGKAVQYSLPGRCPSQPLDASNSKPVQCMVEEPGGECGIPDGSPTCTWKAEYAGEIRIDELSGITDPLNFCSAGGLEYNPQADKGVGTDFWNGRRSPSDSLRRVQAARELFQLKYPNYPLTLGDPRCDWPR